MGATVSSYIAATVNKRFSIKNQPAIPTGIRTAAILAVLIATTYFHVLDFEWQFDSKPHIRNNPAIHLQYLNPKAIWDTLFSGALKGSGVNRPIPRLSFALNWYFGGDNPKSYRAINIFLHGLTAVCLYMVSHLILKTPSGRRIVPEEWSHEVALLSTFLWAANPMQTQAVTYIVQRMALLASLFYLAGVLCYLRLRFSENQLERRKYALMIGLFLFLGVGSKENAIMLPFSILLVEWIFFREAEISFITPRVVGLLALAIALTAVLTYIVTDGQFWGFIKKWYATRTFSMAERLLTQPRVLIHYLLQLFFPIPARLSIEHDVVVSTRLMAPWSTLPAIMLVFTLMVGTIARARRNPLLGFGLLFFLLNHVVESSFLPLELFFEHRNYLPSCFLFLALAAMIVRLTRSTMNVALRGIVAGALVLTCIALGIGTHARNWVWRSEKSLWTDAAIKAPGSARPLNNLAVALAWRENITAKDLHHALNLLERARGLTAVSTSQRAGYIANIGTIYHRLGQIEKSTHAYREALVIEPTFRKARFDMTGVLIDAGRWDEAGREADILLSARPDHSDYLAIKGHILLWQRKPEDAIPFFRECMRLKPDDALVWLSIGYALTKAGSYANGEWFLRKASSHLRASPFPLMALIENRVKADDEIGAAEYAKLLIATYPVTTVFKILDKLDTNFRMPPVERDLVEAVIHSSVFNTDINDQEADHADANQ